MGRRLGQARALHRIERDLVASDPGLDALFLSLSGLGGGKGMPDMEKIRPGPLRLLARLGRRAYRHQPDEDWHIRGRTVR